MNKKMGARDFEEIDRLIQNDVDEALRVFRSGDFGKRLRARIVAEAGAKTARSFLRKTAIPAAAATLLAVSAALFLVNIHRPPAPTPFRPLYFEALLRQLPAFSRPAAELPSGPDRAAGMSGSGGGFLSVLASAERRKAEEEQKIISPTNRPKVPGLSLRKKMEILYKDKVIERALMILIGKIKEA